MGTVKSFEELVVWRKSMDLIEKIYQITKEPPFYKDFGLVDQIRRASISIAANIAEGMERDGNKELINFLFIAKGSCGELICHIHIARRLEYINKLLFEEIYNFAIEISKALGKFIHYLKGSGLKGKKYK
jgi:four helix bundle protein